MVYQGHLLNHGEMCMAFDPDTRQPVGLFWKGEHYNPYLDIDGDEAAKDKDGKTQPRWKFWCWGKREKDRD